MISKYSCFLDKEGLHSYFGIDSNQVIQNSYHLHPEQLCTIITQENPSQVQQCQWGLVPQGSRSVNKHLINANVEGISSKTSFRIPFRNKRCIIPADSFYAYVDRKVPHRFQVHKTNHLAFAGLYDDCQGLRTFTLITRHTTAGLLSIIPSVPVILTKDNIALWLSGETPLQTLKEILSTSKENVITHYPITNQINNHFYDRADLHSEVKITQTLFQT